MADLQSIVGTPASLDGLLRTLPALASLDDPQCLADSLAAWLCDGLAADFVVVRVGDEARTLEALRATPAAEKQQAAIRAALSTFPAATIDGDMPVARLAAGSAEMRIISQPFGKLLPEGVIFVGSERADFPTASERLLLQLGASQAALLLNHLRRAQLLREQEERLQDLEIARTQADVEFGQRVRSRTAELQETNRRLRTEIEERTHSSESLLDSEERFYLLVASVVDYAIYLLDPEGHVVSWNAGAERLKQYSAAEIIGRPFSLFYTPEDAARGQPERLLAIAASEGHVKDEGWRVRKDGSRFWADVVITALRDTDGRLRGFAKVTRDMTERRQAEEQLAHSNANLRMLATHVQTAREEERTTIARELHDELGQMLTVARLDLSRLVRRLGSETTAGFSAPDGVAEVRAVIQWIDECLKATRRIMQQLRPQLLDEFGLKAALEAHVQQFQQRTNIQCVFDAPEELAALEPEKEIAVFRIVQEALTNVARHSGASQARVSLSVHGSELLLEIHDNGKGIAADRMEKAGHFGLLGMKERAILLGGEVAIRGAAGQGTTVTARIPFT